MNWREFRGICSQLSDIVFLLLELVIGVAVTLVMCGFILSLLSQVNPNNNRRTMKVKKCLYISSEVDSMLLKLYTDSIQRGDKIPLSAIVEECIIAYANQRGTNEASRADK